MKTERARSLPGIVLAATTLVLVVALVIAARWPGRGADLVTVNPLPVAAPSPTSAPTPTGPASPSPATSVDAAATTVASSSHRADPAPRRTTPRRSPSPRRTATLRVTATPQQPSPAAPAPSPQPPSQPERAVLTVTNKGTTVSAGYVVLSISNVVPNRGTLASITVFGGPVAVGIAPSPAGPYTASVSGLQLGVAYSFSARVCNSLGSCTDSAAESVTIMPPAPTAGTVSLTRSTFLYVVWSAVISPTPATTCSVRLERGGVSLGSVAVGRAAGSVAYQYAGLGSYQAVKTCTWEGGTVVARSSVITL